MKKFIIIMCSAIGAIFLGWMAYFYFGFYIDLNPDAPVTTFMKADESKIYMERNGGYVEFEIRGVDMGVGIPGEWATDFAISKETYLRWFKYIQELGANTVRVYTILHDDFYNAFYEYNTEREKQGEEPLWLLHGVWVDDYSHNSHKDMYDEGLLPEIIQDSKTIIDIIHGSKFLLGRDGDANGLYTHDVSKWVLGYILGVEWESSLVTYTNQNNHDKTSYQGEYMYSTEDATPFEVALAQIGDEVVEYESVRYKEQRLVAFSNWPTTDPFKYSLVTSRYRYKSAAVNVEHIKQTDSFISGYFASYHVYSYFPDYLNTEDEASEYTYEEIERAFGDNVVKTLEHRLSLMNGVDIHDYLTGSDYYDSKGRYNTYLAYLTAINRFHNIPVVISEYGLTTGRGMAQIDENTGRNQGHMTEQEQGEAIIECYEDIMAAGSAGSCLFSWQDEWFKRTWNTLHAVDLDNNPYWSDYQTNEQFYGLLTFDPGEEESVCYVDGDASEWTDEDIVIEDETGSLSMKYDEKFIYFYVQSDDFDSDTDELYIPLDITPKSGSTYCENYDISFERACDFVICIDGENDSRVVVQERYEVLKAIYWESYYIIDPYISPPEADSPQFVNIDLAMKLMDLLPREKFEHDAVGETYETGKLRYGNADPDSDDFDSLSDYMFTGGGVEIRIPWQLLNFSNPSEMMIHDDYYERYGIDNLHIDEIYAGFGFTKGEEYRIPMASVELKGWGKTVTSHERLKESYYILQDYWAQLDAEKTG